MDKSYSRLPGGRESGFALIEKHVTLSGGCLEVLRLRTFERLGVL